MAMTGNVGGRSVGGSGADYGQQFLPREVNGDWHCDNDMHQQIEMIRHILSMMKPIDENDYPKYLTKLPRMVNQLEISLYRSAPSLEAYIDKSTLKLRL
jgi:hypothetical protein